MHTGLDMITGHMVMIRVRVLEGPLRSCSSVMLLQSGDTFITSIGLRRQWLEHTRSVGPMATLNQLRVGGRDGRG